MNLRRGDVLGVRDERWRVVRHRIDGGITTVDAVGCSAANRTATARFLLPFEPVRRFSAAPRPRLVRTARWRHSARRLLADAQPSWASLTAATRADLDLIPFQLEPTLALLNGHGCRFLIADAVGLGKTVEAGLMIAETLSRNAAARALVICPAGLREQWCGELIHRFGLGPVVFDAYGVAHAAARLPPDVNPWALQPLVITSIDFVKRPEVVRALERLTWDIVVLDEAHNLAGRSDRAAAAGMLGRRARVVVMLTATPHSGDDRAFDRLCDLGRLTASEPLVAFRRTRSDAGVARPVRGRLLRVRTTAAEAAMHEALLAYTRQVWAGSSGARPGARLVASLLARRACSSPDSLARSITRRLAMLATTESVAAQPALPFGPPDTGDEEPSAVLGTPGLTHVADERRLLERLLHLAQAAAAAESKIAALRRFLRRTREPAIVFTEYRDTLNRLAQALGGMDAVELHGGLTARERADALRRFNDGRARLLLATDAGSEGLNLHHRCRLVINLELPWTPLRLEQRAGRVDRLGQRRRVHVIHLVAAGTCEHSVLARLVSRISRLRGSMGLLARLPDEQHVASSVFDAAPLPDPVAPAAVAPHVVTVDVRRQAETEARRIQIARALRNAERHPGSDDRPAIARIRRRRGRTGPPQCVWAFRAHFTGAHGRLLWQTLIPLVAALRGGHEPAAVRALLDPDQPVVQRAISRACALSLRGLRAELRRPLACWRAREGALVTALQADHGRLAACLLQGGLFTRSNERIAAAQSRQLEDALRRSRARLAELADSADPRVDSFDLGFGALME
ncbi:MAG: hypothetical protein A3F70_16450 [Acidobacteria bacterium RIFCSPLOWO2_12_FULL_67_14]|nr:MAG: hypothetical protein A3F70_16450 [Acidobacteria bacterium RIFCSPLOWO2_12_FULL_67_14]